MIHAFNSSTLSYHLKCRALKTYRALRKLGRPAVDNQFLFVLCPPYSGSSLMREIICSSPEVSPTNVFGTGEGHGVPEMRQMIDYRRRWDEAVDYPWPSIKALWLEYWDTSKPILMDKSPPNLIRAGPIQEHFKPAWFIVMTRNPYAHCEGMMRRDKLTTKDAAQFALKCLRHQKRNAELLERNCVVRYEDLVLDPHSVKHRLGQFMPQLRTVVVDGLFSAHNHKEQRLPIIDFNGESIERLTAEQISELNQVFAEEQGLLAYFRYQLLSPEPEFTAGAGSIGKQVPS
jgi:hypothetical protein